MLLFVSALYSSPIWAPAARGRMVEKEVGLIPHAFGAVPFGTGPAPDGQLMGFDQGHADPVPPPLQRPCMVGINAMECVRSHRYCCGYLDCNDEGDKLADDLQWAICSALERNSDNPRTDCCLPKGPMLSGAEAFHSAVASTDQDITSPSLSFIPRHVFLFSGHMVDAPGRAIPRFPADKEVVAARRIAAALDVLGAGPGDLALAQGASGGDILFLEACRERGVRLQLMLPLQESEFIERSILPCTNGEHWLKRYLSLKAGLQSDPLVLPDEMGLHGEANPFERCNLWMLNTALSCGEDKVRFLCLWDGGGGDGPGGTAHLYHEAQRRTGNVIWLDTRKLW